jgi:ATP-dependent DNA helicase RecQ
VTDLLDALRQLTGRPDSSFREGQREAIEALALRHERVMLVQRTGWGKSAVYFLATRLLRDAGHGPTLLISPLLALMRNQLDAARRVGLRAFEMNSAAVLTIAELTDMLGTDSVDLLLVSPERLANPEFAATVMPLVARRPGMIVIDEVHCISDWGHDFRPDYRRLAQVIANLPGEFPVLGCTATANDRVVLDAASQLGAELNVIRGPLRRSGLSLQVIELPQAAQRMAWLDLHLPDLPGSGIIYCLTVGDAERVAAWLQRRGHAVLPYTGQTDPELRVDAEAALQANAVKALVATSALGMGYDKPDLGFVVHYQSPGSPVFYYQQVGRAGRAVDTSVGVLLRGDDDEAIQDWFIEQSFPDEEHVTQVLRVFERAGAPTTLARVEDGVNLTRGALELVLKQLTVEGVLVRHKAQTYERTPEPWTYPRARIAAVTAARRAEQQQLRMYAATDHCRMVFLTRLLDDASEDPCGLCDVCSEPRHRGAPAPRIVADALRFLRQGAIVLEPRKQLVGSGLKAELRVEPGRALCMAGDQGWSPLVDAARHDGRAFDDELVDALALLVTEWNPQPSPTWVTSVPSVRRPVPVADLARRVAAHLRLPVLDVLVKLHDTPPQSRMRNSAHQFSNVAGSFALRGDVPDGPVLLVDDLADSRWTITEVGRVLRTGGAGPVFPVALASTLGRDT